MGIHTARLTPPKMVVRALWVHSPLVLIPTPASQAHFCMVQVKNLRNMDGCNIFKGLS